MVDEPPPTHRRRAPLRTPSKPSPERRTPACLFSYGTLDSPQTCGVQNAAWGERPKSGWGEDLTQHHLSGKLFEVDASLCVTVRDGFLWVRTPLGLDPPLAMAPLARPDPFQAA